ncbi:SusC/RagA family TonB-linked outer membrane protein [Hufsiella ginkgonis]|uniref:SusC/RagA family TonB-linked outer membrane protein n=1 Tax=Hufsiella ginkgonis TaxID=2695274 RepID=A0A7K1Y1X1_9SPHI|nr:TonB-dependent receptor [Hufsiella ginkgonis]MXV17019.1 SusC/RagA family TonB-linked outer membrane protein [Hufsiella ginkgonis]
MKRIRQKLLRGSVVALFLLVSGLHLAVAQSVQVKGTVKDSKGEPLIGTTIKLKGTTVGASTNADGAFVLTVPSSGGTLVFSALGYLTKEIAIPADRTVNVVLENDTKALEEVVVVGYGTQQKASVTGAISQINSVDIVRSPAVAATNALVGKIPGITSRSQDSRPGNGTNLQIRNLGTPLYVIDGVPYSTNDSQSAFGFNSNNSGANVFNNLGLEDIESVTILKDASAAVYGLRASNGVVLVTTKKGKRETSMINVTSYYGMQNFTRYPHPANAGQFVRAQLEAEQNKSLAAGNPSLLFTPDVLAKWEAGTEKGYKSYDYFDAVTRPNVPQYYLSANASGGSQRSNYYFSVSHINQDALIKDFTYGRTNLQANLDASLAKGLKIGTQISGRLQKAHNVGVPGLDDYFNPLLSISSMWPTEPMYANDNPAYINQGHSVNVNPATYKNDVTGYIDEIYRNVNVNLNVSYDFPFGLVAKGTYSHNYTNEDFDGFEFTYDAYNYNAATDTYTLASGNQNPWREKHKRNIFSNFAQFQLNYQKSFGFHSLSAVAAYERSEQENDYLAIHSVPPNNYIPIMQFANQDFLADAWEVEARAGYTGRINYSYKQKYLLEVLGRYDGSYLYAADKRWGFFPGMSVGWRLSEEPFIKNKIGGVVNDLKIRASYGETGSESGINRFDYLAGYNFNSGSAVLDGNYVIGLRPRGLPITNLSWVNNKLLNLGLDFGMLNGLTGQFDIFKRKRSGLPASKYDVLLPSEAGYTLPNENLNSDETRGVEGLLSFDKRLGKIDFSISANGTIGRSRNIAQYKPRRGNSWDYYRNSAIDRWTGINFGYEIVGRFQSQQEIDNYKVNNDGQGNRTQLPGDFMYKDSNGDGIITTEDQRPIGYATGATPYMSYGSSLSVGFKGINLAADFSGATMQSFSRDVELKFPFQNNGNSPKYMFTDRWHRENPYDLNSAWIPGTYPALRRNETGHANFRQNQFWLTNVSYFRLRNLEVGYTFPQKLMKRVGVSKLRVYANGSNLFSFDSVKDFEIDPEISSSGGLIYPQQRLYNFGFNLTL